MSTWKWSWNGVGEFWSWRGNWGLKQLPISDIEGFNNIEWLHFFHCLEEKLLICPKIQKPPMFVVIIYIIYNNIYIYIYILSHYIPIKFPWDPHFKFPQPQQPSRRNVWWCRPRGPSSGATSCFGAAPMLRSIRCQWRTGGLWGPGGCAAFYGLGAPKAMWFRWKINWL